MSTKETKELLVENLHALIRNMDKCLDKQVLKVMKENEPQADFLGAYFSPLMIQDSLSFEDCCLHLHELDHALGLMIKQEKRYADMNLTGEKDVITMCDIIGGFPNSHLNDDLVACAREVLNNAKIDLQLYLNEEDVKKGAMMTYAKILAGANRTVTEYNLRSYGLDSSSTMYLRGWVYDKYYEAREALGNKQGNSKHEDDDTMISDMSRLMMCSEMARKYGDNYEIIDMEEFLQHHRREELSFDPNGNCGSLFCHDKYVFGIRCMNLIWAEGNCEGLEFFWNKKDYEAALKNDFSKSYNAILIHGNHKGELMTKLLVFHEKQ